MAGAEIVTTDHDLDLAGMRVHRQYRSLGFGSLLAMAVLFFFLRRGRSLAAVLATVPLSLAVAFDESLTTCFRNELFPDYKAHRPLPPPELEAQLEKNEVTIELEPAARQWIADRGYDRDMGARPMARVIQEHIKRPLAEELLFGILKDGGHVRIDCNEDSTGLVLIPEATVRELEHLADQPS